MVINLVWSLLHVSTLFAIFTLVKLLKFLMDAIPLCTNIGVYLFTSITQQKSFKRTNYILVHAWRHVSAVLTAILRPTFSTDQVQI